MNPRDIVINYRYCAEHFNRDEYPALFERVKGDVETLLFEICQSSQLSADEESRHCLQDTGSGTDGPADTGNCVEIALKKACSEILDEVECNMRKHRFKFRRESARADDHLVLSLFVVPAAARIGTPIAVKFAETLASMFTERFPGTTFKVGDYDEIMEGFKWKLTLISK